MAFIRVGRKKQNVHVIETGCAINTKKIINGRCSIQARFYQHREETKFVDCQCNFENDSTEEVFLGQFPLEGAG